MLTPQDDLIGHQCAAPFAARVGQGDERFTERYWYTAHPVDDSPLLLDLGLGYYPNRGVMDAFAGVTIGRRQTNFRASRRLGPCPLDTQVGPLRFEVIEGMKRHSVTLTDNASGIAFELDFEASFPAAQEKQSFRERDGVLQEDMTRVAQLGRWRGWLQVDGQRHRIEPATWCGQRGHSWGIRTPMVNDETRPPVVAPTHFFWTWAMCQFGDLGLSLFLKEREPGKPWYLSGAEFQRDAAGAVLRREITAARHEYHWADDPLGQSMHSAAFELEFDHGPPRTLHLDALPTRYYLKAGLYGGYKGWNHGDDRGEYHCEHDVWDLDDPATRLAARTLSDHVVRARSEGQVGHGISEYGVAPGYPKYLAPQRFPAL